MVFLDGALIRIDEDDPAESVDDHQVSPDDGGRDVIEADHRGDSEGPRHDGGVGGLAADVGRKAMDPAGIELRGLRRSQVVGDDDDFSLESIESLDLLAEQGAQNQFLDVKEIVDSLGDDRRIHRREFFDVTVQYPRDGMLRRVMLVANRCNDLFSQHRVGDEIPVDLQDLGMDLDLRPEALDILIEALLRKDYRLLVALDLILDLRLLDEALGDAQVLGIEGKRLPDHNPRTDRDPLLQFHRYSSCSERSGSVKIGLHEIDECVESLALISTFDPDGDLVAKLSAQGEDGDDRFAIDRVPPRAC